MANIEVGRERGRVFNSPIVCLPKSLTLSCFPLFFSQFQNQVVCLSPPNHRSTSTVKTSTDPPPSSTQFQNQAFKGLFIPESPTKSYLS
ncbi:hypothetical protein E1A91_D12G072400v1 [Gossypium mustelinum]|uniref:Uncharacterized protein n=1 Tax=Gossypium mustelinum TaxID=34275 RepID=A0A5D2SBN6_GOSMU|nr:hypothetical protein E1A91_D12G072400v1 [Gossypium mustelinum]